MEKSRWTEEYSLCLTLLRRAREAKGLTQTELAERLGTGQAWVSKSERGERRVDIIDLRRYCRALGVSLSGLIEELETAIIERTPMENDIPQDERRFTVKNAHTNAVMFGLENVPGTNGNLMLAELAPGEKRHWFALAVGEHTNLKEDMIVVRVH